MEKPLQNIYQNLQTLTGLHRQLLETVRIEREALVQADLLGIQKAISSKQALLESIHQTEMARLKLMTDLSIHWKQPFRQLTLTYLIIQIQGDDPKGAEQFRSLLNALTVLIQRITAQNKDNKNLVECSLGHVHQMKKNSLAETTPRSSTYTSQGQRAQGAPAQRFLSREA